MKRLLGSSLAFTLLLTSDPSGTAQAAFPTLVLKTVVQKQFHAPTNIVSANDASGRLFIVDQPGKIYIFKGGMLMPTPFLNIANASNLGGNSGPGPVIGVNTNYSERGLLGLAFHPGFSNPASPGYRKFYVNYTKAYNTASPDFDPAPPQVGDPVNCVTIISEYQVSPTDPNVALVASERRLLAFTQPQSNHNGGQLEFGPDGYLYIGTGDGGGSNDNGSGHTGSTVSTTANLGNAQDKTRFLGKILRIDPLDPDGAGPLKYSIPPTNPFVGAGGGVKEEIFAYGLRNPWRFCFDKRPGGTNRLFCGDVGQGRIEEVNLIVSGGNYGWRYKEGLELPSFSSGSSTNPMPNPGGTMIDPIAMYAHPGVTPSTGLPELGLSITGGFVYRGSAIPALQGKYVFADYGAASTAVSDGRLMGLEETAPGSGTFTLTQALPLFGMSNPILGRRILCMGEDEAGEIYIGFKTTGGVLQLDGGLPAGGLFKIVPMQSASVTITANKDNTIFSENPPHAPMTGFVSDGQGYLYAGETTTNFGPYSRRALVSFDVSQIPSGAVVQSAQFKLRVTKLGPSAFGSTFAVHRLTETWGEGTSLNTSGGYGAQATVGDATWVRRFFDTQSWTTAGGSFNATASASIAINSVNVTFPSNAQLVSDVQGWVTTPASNAGWIVRGDEAIEGTATQFSSVQQGGVPPSLIVDYQSAPAPTPFETWLATYFPSNLPGQWVDPDGDNDGDGIKNQIEYAWGFNPTSMDSSSDFSTSAGPNFFSPDDTDLNVTFRRDTSATDLTYKLQSSSDLTTWTTIAQSTAGAAPTAKNGGVIVSDLSLSGSINLVTVRQTIPAAAADKKFVRLQVDRQ